MRLSRLIYMVFLLSLSSLSCQHTNLKPSNKLLGAAKGADIVLVGEQHDNADHHLFQANFISSLWQQNRLAAVVMEHLFVKQEKIIAENPLESLETALKWKSSGWPPYEMFEPIFDVVKKNGIPVVAGGIPRESLKQLYQGRDPGLLSLENQTDLALQKDLPKPASDALLKTILKSHCGYIDRNHALKMIPIQRYRDAFLAQKALDSAKDTKVVIILAGSGHVRKDFGIPYYLNNSAQDLKLMSIKLSEDHKSDEDLHGQLFDFYLPLKGVGYDDPCQKFKETLKKSFKKGKDSLRPRIDN